MSDTYVQIGVALLAILAALAFYFMLKNERKQREWREKKLKDMAAKRANIIRKQRQSKDI